MADRIMTIHPENSKAGVNIDRVKYEAIREAIIESIRENGEIAFQELPGSVDKHLGGAFDGSIGWYVTTVKLDLEARGVIERIPRSNPQRLRLVE
jgi:hypothetical protein